jgi:multisubunit Na+/H+ antiporter MnhC subunit
MRRYLLQAPDTLPADLNADGRVTIGELVVSALVLAASMVVGLATLAGCAWLLFRPETAGWLRLATIIVGLATLAAATLLIWRMTHYERHETLTRQEIERRRMFEDEDRAVRNELQAQDGQARISQADVDAAVWDILKRYYAGKPWARGKVPGVSEPRWNMANEILKKCGLRQGNRRSLEPETFDIAWSQFLQWRRKTRAYYVTSEGDLITK